MELFDAVNLIIRFLILFFLSVESQIAIKKRMYLVALLTTGLWITFFRLTLFRALTIYAGAFKHETNSFVKMATNFVSTSPVANITDFLVLIGIIGLFTVIVTHEDCRKLKRT